MANTMTTIADLANEVGDLIRHDNLDSRINQWLLAAWNDLCQRGVLDLFSGHEEVTVLSGNTSASMSGSLIGTPRCVIAVDTGGIVYIPKYLSPIDYARLSAQDTNAPAAGPRFWSIEMSGSTLTLYVWPATTGNTVVTILSSGNPVTTEPAGSGYFPIPYHFEHVLIWGATAIAASGLDKSMYTVFQGEYESALADLIWIMNLRPDGQPIMRSLTGTYAGSPRMSAPPRVPDIIS